MTDVQTKKITDHQHKKSVLIYAPVYQTRRYVSLALLLLSLIVLGFIVLNPHIHSLTLMIILSFICIVAYILAFYADKPKVSFSLTFMHLQQHTRKGGWCVKWCHIQEIGIPSISYEGWEQALPSWGIKLKNYEPLLDNISLRLASHMIIEQRGLIIHAFRHSDMAARKKIEDIILDDTPFVASSGKTYKGLMAMFANRMVYTRELLGFDVIVHEDVLESSAEDFVGLARGYLASKNCHLTDSK